MDAINDEDFPEKLNEKISEDEDLDDVVDDGSSDIFGV